MDQDEHLLTTRRFNVVRVTHELADGGKVDREVIRHPGSVVILPICNAEEICLIRNHRVAVGKTLLEIPAGTLEVGEEPIRCAERELIEETGYRAKHVESFGGFYAAPGILDEYMHLFVARDLTPGAPERELGEEIENVVMTWDEAFEAIRNGTIQDAKTIIGLLRYQQQHNPA